jgi:hypothetical protein
VLKYRNELELPNVKDPADKFIEVPDCTPVGADPAVGEFVKLFKDPAVIDPKSDSIEDRLLTVMWSAPILPSTIKSPDRKLLMAPHAEAPRT